MINSIYILLHSIYHYSLPPVSVLLVNMSETVALVNSMCSFVVIPTSSPTMTIFNGGGIFTPTSLRSSSMSINSILKLSLPSVIVSSLVCMKRHCWRCDAENVTLVLLGLKSVSIHKVRKL